MAAPSIMVAAVHVRKTQCPYPLRTHHATTDSVDAKARDAEARARAQDAQIADLKARLADCQALKTQAQAAIDQMNRSQKKIQDLQDTAQKVEARINSIPREVIRQVDIPRAASGQWKGGVVPARMARIPGGLHITPGPDVPWLGGWPAGLGRRIFRSWSCVKTEQLASEGWDESCRAYLKGLAVPAQ